MTATAEHALQSDVAPPPFALIDPEKQLEWVNGQVVVKEPGGARHSRICTRLTANLGLYVEEHWLGAIYGPDTTFTIGQNQRLPDVSFVAAAHIPPEGDPVGIWTIAPDLAVEVVSPNDLHEDVMEKIHEYLAAGVRQVWLVSPQFKTVTIYDSPTQVTILTEADELTSEELLSDFRYPISALFQAPIRSVAG
jgi:Uma2 family endonuclease